MMIVLALTGLPAAEHGTLGHLEKLARAFNEKKQIEKRENQEVYESEIRAQMRSL